MVEGAALHHFMEGRVGGDLEAEGVAGEEEEAHDVARQDAVGHIQIRRRCCHQISHHCTCKHGRAVGGQM